jgi:flagellar biogenesis protein FliO
MEVIRQFGAIALTLALVAASLWWLQRKSGVQWNAAPFRRARSGKMMEVIESRALCPGHTLHVVRIADRVMALATHSGGCTLLETRPWVELRATAPEGQA